ncbi:MAG: 50S ribosomal protein L32 [Gemmatales bacterium]
MAVPKRRTSKAAKGKRRSHINTAKAVRHQYCAQCGEPVLPHRVCAACGFYAQKGQTESRHPLKEAATQEK